jgi:hypothetical protein
MKCDLIAIWTQSSVRLHSMLVKDDAFVFYSENRTKDAKTLLGPGYTRDWLPAYSFVVRARAILLTGERTLWDTSGARQYCPQARQTAADNYVYGLSSALKNRLRHADQSTVSDAKLRHSPGMPAAEKHKLVYETPNYVISHAAARWYHCTTVNYRDSSVRGYHDKTVSPCPCSYDKIVCGQPISSVAPLLYGQN